MRSTIELICAHCGKSFIRDLAQHEYCLRRGSTTRFCALTCSAAHRSISKEDKKAKKAEYDRKRRERMGDVIRQRKKDYYASIKNTPENRAKEKAIRDARMPLHVEYCRRPEYKVKKSAYDRKRRASEYGSFGDAYELLLQVENTIRSLVSKEDIYRANCIKQWNPAKQREYRARRKQHGN